MGIHGVHVFTGRVAHEGFAHIGQDAEFQQSRIEAMTQIVKSEPLNTRAADGRSPSSLDLRDRLSFEWKDRPFSLP